MQVYVINLAPRQDRLRHITAELERVGVSFQRLEAVDAKSSPEVHALEGRRPCRTGYVISDGAVACSLSHMNAWRALLDSGDSHCVVLEDDVLISEDFAACVSPGWLPEGADVVRLETFATRVHLVKRPSGFLGARGVHRMLTRHLGAAAYIISRQGAESLLEVMAPLADAVDETMFNDTYGWMPQANVYQLSPATAIQADRIADARIRNADFASGSIEFRGLNNAPKAREALGPRLVRRLRNEVLAWKMRSTYCVVPFQR